MKTLIHLQAAALQIPPLCLSERSLPLCGMAQLAACGWPNEKKRHHFLPPRPVRQMSDAFHQAAASCRTLNRAQPRKLILP
jgi:hypothetical protein